MWSNHHGHALLEGVHTGTSFLGSNWAASCKVEDAQGSLTRLGTCTRLLTATLFVNVRDSNEPQFPFAGEQVNRPCYVHLLE